ncbi:antitoxin MazE family protein [Bosea sp. UC22_33]|uniref:antitoxin MazE family protein n=1 Tax=Bosea sp. UC22_33 TaxID=3350165 RepID=UPI00366BFD79
MASSTARRVQKRRDALRAAGLRPVQIWVPDTRSPGFSTECSRQARLVAASDNTDRELDAFLDIALEDLNRAPNEAR